MLVHITRYTLSGVFHFVIKTLGHIKYVILIFFTFDAFRHKVVVSLENFK